MSKIQHNVPPHDHSDTLTGDSVDASVITYTPADVTDWAGSVDPGQTKEALDQLADRVDTLEGAGSSTCVAFITNASSLGTVSGKVYETNTIPATKVLEAFTSDHNTVDISFELEGGPDSWLPASITVTGGSVPVTINKADYATAAASGGAEMTVLDTNDRRWSGKIRINANASSTIYLTTSDGGQSQNVTYTRALDPPTVLTAVFNTHPTSTAGDPNVQGRQVATTSASGNQYVRVTGTTQSHATRVFIKSAGASSALQGPFTVTAGVFDTGANVLVRSSGNTGAQTVTVYADTGAGTTAGPDFNTTNTVTVDHTLPTYTGPTVTNYNGASGQEALKDSETAVVTITHTNPASGDTYIYNTAGTNELSIPADTTYAASKTVTRIAGNYRETGTNYLLTITRTDQNGTSVGPGTVVKIAHTTPVITITDNANAAFSLSNRMGTDNGAVGYRDWTVKIRSSQANLSTYTASVSLALGAGDTSAWQGSWVTSGIQDYTRALRVEDGDIKAGGQAANTYTWGAVSVKNRAGKIATVVTTNPTYYLGGFQTRTLTQPAVPVHQIAIGCRVVNTAKLTAINLSKGGSPTQVFEANITEHNNPNPDLNNYFTISNGSDVYAADGTHYHNSDKLFSDSNTSGTAQISIAESTT